MWENVLGFVIVLFVEGIPLTTKKRKSEHFSGKKEKKFDKKHTFFVNVEKKKRTQNAQKKSKKTFDNIWQKLQKCQKGGREWD